MAIFNTYVAVYQRVHSNYLGWHDYHDPFCPSRLGFAQTSPEVPPFQDPMHDAGAHSNSDVENCSPGPWGLQSFVAQPGLGGHPSGVEPTFEAVPRGCMFYRSFQPSAYPWFVVCFFWCTVPAAGWWFTSSSFDTFCFFRRIETTMQATLQ